MMAKASWTTARPVPDKFFQSLDITSEMSGVDLCCGEGHFSAPLAKFVGGKLHLFDVDPEMLRRARAAVERLGGSVREWICDDTERLADVLPELVDFVFIANTAHGVADVEDLAGTVRSALKAHGRFVVVDWYPLTGKAGAIQNLLRGPPPAVRRSPEELRVAVEPVGFRLGNVVDLPPDHYGTVFHKIASKV